MAIKKPKPVLLNNFYLECKTLDVQALIHGVEGLEISADQPSDDKPLASGKGAAKVRRRLTGNQVFSDITVETYLTDSLSLFKWYEEHCNKEKGGAKAGYDRTDFSMTLYDEEGDQLARWELKGAIPTKYVGPSAKVSDSDLATETITIAVEGMERVK